MYAVARHGLNRLNDRQSEIFTEFPLKGSFKLTGRPLGVLDVCLEMSSDSNIMLLTKYPNLGML